METYPSCQDLGYNFISDLVEYSHLKKSIEEVFHFVNIEFEFRFGVTSIMFIYKKFNGEEKIEISRGFSYEFIKRTNENPPSDFLSGLGKSKKSVYIDFSKENDKYREFEYLFEHEGVKEFYGYELATAYTDSYYVIMYSVKGFKNCENNKKDVFDTIFSVLAYILNSNKCVKTITECSQIDHVSGMNNFKYFHEKLFQEMQKTNKSDEKFCVALISLNQLNKLNSVYGHNAGDRYIALIANILRKHIRVFDTSARYGNKFIILFPGIENKEVVEIMNGAFKEIDDLLKREEQDVLSLNAGISTFPADGNNERTILDLAESRRIEARRLGRWVIVGGLF